MYISTFFRYEGPDVRDEHLLHDYFKAILNKLGLPGCAYDWSFCHIYEEDFYAEIDELEDGRMYLAVPVAKI